MCQEFFPGQRPRPLTSFPPQRGSGAAGPPPPQSSGPSWPPPQAQDPTPRPCAPPPIHTPLQPLSVLCAFRRPGGVWAVGRGPAGALRTTSPLPVGTPHPKQVPRPGAPRTVLPPPHSPRAPHPSGKRSWGPPTPGLLQPRVSLRRHLVAAWAKCDRGRGGGGASSERGGSSPGDLLQHWPLSPKESQGPQGSPHGLNPDSDPDWSSSHFFF